MGIWYNGAEHSGLPIPQHGVFGHNNLSVFFRRNAKVELIKPHRGARNRVAVQQLDFKGGLLRQERFPIGELTGPRCFWFSIAISHSVDMLPWT